MKTATITIDGRTGRVFEGEIPETYCFVPEEFIFSDGEGLRVDEGNYIRSRWDVRNMRFNDAGEGQHLFPNAQRLMADLNGERVSIFIRRLASVHCD